MPNGTLQRSHGKSFDQVAGEYDRHRPTYPYQLVDRAYEAADLKPGDRVLEIGCGTGQLTRSLLAQGFDVTAIEPGPKLAALAEQRLQGTNALEIVNARFEDAHLPHARFQAVLSASAIHWVDPDVGWQRIAEVLAPGGTLALIQYFGLRDPRSAEDQQALLDAMTTIAPDIAAEWPRYRDRETILAGIRERRENISNAWSWLGDYELARDYAADLFEDAQITVAVPAQLEHTARELNALIGTMSFWSRLSAEQREAMRSANLALQERIGRPIRSTVLACAITARRIGPR